MELGIHDIFNLFLFLILIWLVFFTVRVDKVSKFRRELMSKILTAEIEDVKIQTKSLAMLEEIRSILDRDDCGDDLMIRWTILDKVSFEKQVLMFWKRPQDFYTPQEFLKMTTPSRGFISSKEKH